MSDDTYELPRVTVVDFSESTTTKPCTCEKCERVKALLGDTSSRLGVPAETKDGAADVMIEARAHLDVVITLLEYLCATHSLGVDRALFVEMLQGELASCLAHRIILPTPSGGKGQTH